MAQDNSGAVSAVQSVSSKSNVGNVGSDTEGLPSQKSVDIATDLAAEFKQPDEKIPAIAQAVEGLLNGKTQADRVDSFKKLAELLGIDLGKEKGGAEEAGGAGAAGGAEEAGGAGDDLESLIEKLIKMLKAKGMSDEQIKALLGPILEALGKSPEEASAMLDKALGGDKTEDSSSTGTAPGAATAAQFNRG
jgi:hypothetical protein